MIKHAAGLGLHYFITKCYCSYKISNKKSQHYCYRIKFLLLTVTIFTFKPCIQKKRSRVLAVKKAVTCQGYYVRILNTTEIKTKKRFTTFLMCMCVGPFKLLYSHIFPSSFFFLFLGLSFLLFEILNTLNNSSQLLINK